MRPKNLLLLLAMLPALLAPNGFALLLCLCVAPPIEQAACCVRTCCEEPAPSKPETQVFAPCGSCCKTLSNPDHGSTRPEGPARPDLDAPLFLPATGPAALAFASETVR